MLNQIVRRTRVAAAAMMLVILLPAPLLAQRGVPGPTNVTVVSNGSTATVSWTPVESRGVLYRVLRAPNETERGIDLTDPIEGVTFEDGKVELGVAYFYQVVAVLADGTLAAAAPVAFTMGKGLRAPPMVAQALPLAPISAQIVLPPAPVAAPQLAPPAAQPAIVQELPLPAVPVQAAPVQAAPVRTAPVQAAPIPVKIDRNKFPRWFLRPEAAPSIAPNSEVLLFLHGMDSRAEEADDITTALFAAITNVPPPVSSAPPPPPNPAPMIAALNQLLQKYRSCVLEKYETQADLQTRGFPQSPPAAPTSGLMTAAGLQPRNVVTCVAGNQCSLANRATGFIVLQAQANRGDPANFQLSLEKIIPQDCFECAKHQEMHTKHVHCTMEAGGNSGFQGPGFEGCKAGVDAVALANSAIRDIGAFISNVTALGAPGASASGGPTIATNRTTVHFNNSCPNPAGGCPESCDNPDFIVGGQRIARVPLDMVQGQAVTKYFPAAIPPWSTLLDSPAPQGTTMNVPAAHNLGQNEGRLQPALRAAAKAADPLASLKLAAYKFGQGNALWGNAFADLSVTGHKAFEAFSRILPQDDYCQWLVGQAPPPSFAQMAADTLIAGCRSALERAYRVANFLRTGQRGDTLALKLAKVAERNALGWIAVSGEDDSPHRPVDVPSSDFPQYDLLVNVGAPFSPLPQKQVAVHTRYTIAQSPQPSRNGKTLVVISLDLPTQGYATNLSYNDVSPLLDIGVPKTTNVPFPIVVVPGIEILIPGVGAFPPGTIIPANVPLPDFQASGNTPILQFIEDFVVGFVDGLNQNVPVKANLKAVMGGSLGGNITMRLGRRQNADWIQKVVVWSPASIWDSLGGGADILKHAGPRKAWENANQALSTAPDSPQAAALRSDFFGSWDKAIVPVIIPLAQSDTWMSDFYLCKRSSVAGARLDRQETYDQNFLAWHWRLGAEQLLFSHQTIDPMTREPLYMSNTKPMLLGCGLEDHVPYNDICPATQTTAVRMTRTPGKALFLGETGHSLDNERRTFWAQQMIGFLGL